MADRPRISAANRKYVSAPFTGQADPYYSTIQAAINSITNESATNVYGIYIYPGEYDESVTLKSYVSLIGSGIDDVLIKGNSVSPAITGPASDSGGGQSFITNLTSDGNGQSAVTFWDTTTSKLDLIIDVQVITSQAASTAITVGNNQTLNCFGLICPITPTLFTNGFQVTGNGR